MMADDQQEHVWTMMNDLKFCHLITQHHGKPSPKPMTALTDPKAHTVHILTSAGGDTVGDIQGVGNVFLTFSNGGEKNLVVEAQAAVSNDRGLIKSLWNPGAQAFWPEGPDTPDVRVLVLAPEKAEYWEGSAGVMGALKFAVAIATRSQPGGAHARTAM